MVSDELKNFVKENMKRTNECKYFTMKNLIDCEFLCFDTESCRDFNNREMERVYAWALSNTINDEVVYGLSITEFIEFLKTLYFYDDKPQKNKKYKKVFEVGFIHNLAWDVEFFKYELEKMGFKYFDKILFTDGSVEDETVEGNAYNITENNGQVYNFTLQINVDKNYYITVKFYDSLKIVPQSLDSIAKKVITIDEMFYKLKDEYDYKKVRQYNEDLTEDEKCYIYNDVYILKEFIKQYYINHNLKGFTASGIAFNNLLNFLYPKAKKKYEEFEKNYPPINDILAEDIITKSYSGGFTYASPKMKCKNILKHGYSIDINSSYPAQMKYKKLPYGQPKYFKGKYKKDKKYDICLQHINFDVFKRKNDSYIGFIKTSYAKDFAIDFNENGFKKNDYLATNIVDNKLICYNFDMIVTNEELDFLLSVYDFYSYKRVNGKILKGKKNLVDGVTYVDGVKFKSRVGDFGNFIDDAVTRKNQAKEDNNEIMKVVAKTDMNSIYGKLGTSYQRVIMEYVKNNHGIFEHQRKYANENEYDYLENRKYYRAYSSFVTSYGRVKLQKVIVQIEQLFGVDNFIYCDTDSIYMTLSMEQIKKLDIELDKYKLGAWDIEKEFFKIKTLGAKKYIVYARDYGKTEKCHNVCKCAGLPDNIRSEINFDNFNLGAKFTKKQKRKVIGGYSLVNTTLEIKAFMFYI